MEQTLPAGSTLTLNVSATGILPITYQWYKDGGRLLGVTNSTFNVTNAGVLNSGMYFVVVSNSTGISISVPAPVVIGHPSLLTWGDNAWGELGNGTTNNSNHPLPLAENVAAATAGTGHTLFVALDGRVWAVGNNAAGQLGDGTESQADTPVCVLSNMLEVAAGADFSFFLTNSSNYGASLLATGDGVSGQINEGFGPLATISRPAFCEGVSSLLASGSLTFVTAVAAGSSHDMLVLSHGSLYGMGWDGDGQIADEPLTRAEPEYWPDTPAPSEAIISDYAVAVAAGTLHTIYLQADGTLWGAGSNGHGQLGDPTTNQEWVPILIATHVTTIAAGAYHSLFVKDDGTLWSMGYNAFGQLGDGTTNDSAVPVCVASNVVEVAAGATHSLFIKSDGTLWAMGNNADGQLGNGTTNNAIIPVVVPGVLAASVFPEDQAFHSLVSGISFSNSIAMSGGLPNLTFVGTPGANYAVMRSTNLVNWSVIWTTNAPVNGVVQLTDPSPLPLNAFYQLQPVQ